MKKYFLLIVLSLLLVFLYSCKNNYEYVEFERIVFDNSNDLNKKEAVKIKAKNDTMAYIEAFEKFCISQKTYEITNEDGTAYSKPVKFHIYDEKGNDISDVNFKTKELEEDKIKLITGIKGF